MVSCHFLVVFAARLLWTSSRSMDHQLHITRMSLWDRFSFHNYCVLARVQNQVGPDQSGIGKRWSRIGAQNPSKSGVYKPRSPYSWLIWSKLFWPSSQLGPDRSVIGIEWFINPQFWWVLLSVFRPWFPYSWLIWSKPKHGKKDLCPQSWLIWSNRRSKQRRKNKRLILFFLWMQLDQIDQGWVDRGFFPCFSLDQISQE